MKSIELAFQKTVTKPEELMEIFHESIKLGFEGIMAKKIESSYRAGARDFTWVKLKHSGKGMLSDTIDCIVLGYYVGRGKRSGFGVGAFLVGIRANGKIVTICKIGTGLSDEQWRELKIKCDKVKVSARGGSSSGRQNKPEEYDVPKALIPDGWVKAAIVVEIAADEITKSPLHTAGIALRFPRLVRFRDDKSPEDATTVTEVEKIASLQSIHFSKEKKR